MNPIPKNKRVSNPKLLEQMKKDIGYCEYYGSDYNFECLEAAHIIAKGMGGGKGPDMRENIVIVLGPARYGKGAHGAIIPIEEFWKLAAKRESISVEEFKLRVRRAIGYKFEDIIIPENVGLQEHQRLLKVGACLKNKIGFLFYTFKNRD